MLTVFYFGSSSGMVFNLHYCLDEIFVSTGSEKKSCDICGAEQNNDCCKSETKVLKIDLVQKSKFLDVDFTNFPAHIAVSNFDNFTVGNSQQYLLPIQIKAPPEVQHNSLFKIYGNFRI